MQWSHVGRAISAVLFAAAAAVGIVSGLSPFIGLSYAVVVIFTLVAAAILVAVIARPAKSSGPLVLKTMDVSDVESIRLPLRKGDRAYGHIREQDGQTFNWCIVDLSNLKLMERGEEYDYEDGEQEVPNAAVDWTAPSDGPWFLAFDCYRKQYVRRVEVDLWRGG